jgi:thiamine transporter ThiT
MKERSRLVFKKIGKFLFAVIIVLWLYKTIPFFVFAIIKGFQENGLLGGLFWSVPMGFIGCLFILLPLNKLFELLGWKINVNPFSDKE